MAGLHQRDQATANSGIVVELKLEDFSRLQNTVLWLEWNSKSIEQKQHLAGETQRVPAQRMIDFTQSRVSSEIRKHHTFLGLLP
jgi:uncharacterized FAD-dependent dehydrogenase